MLARRRRCGWRSLERGRFNNELRCCSEGNPQGFGVTVQRGCWRRFSQKLSRVTATVSSSLIFTNLAPALADPDSPGSKSRAGAR